MRLALLAVLLLTACAGTEPPLGPPVRPVPKGATEPIRFNTLNLGQMRRGMEIGRYVWNLDCGSPYGRVFWSSGLGFRRENTFRERFTEAFEGAGFDVAGAVYADGVDRARARYTITGELREVRLELCRQRSWLFNLDRGIRGTATVKVDWTIYDPQERRVVLSTATTGHAVLHDGVPEGDVLLMEDGFSSAAEALAADPALRKAVARGAGGNRSPDGKRWRMVPEHERDPLPISAEPVRAAAPRGGAGEGLVRAGAGAGVVVGEAEGLALVLTALAAGESVPVRVGGVRSEGVVTARDPERGLMLVRVPARLAAMRIRDAAPEVSEPVIATGAGDDFATGLIAGLGDGILADLEGQAPEPGDPLLDASGNLLGLALGGRAPAGLTRFVPVGEALAALGVAAEPDLQQSRGNLDGRGRPPT